MEKDEYTLHNIDGAYMGLHGTLEEMRKEAQRFGHPTQIRRNKKELIECHSPYTDLEGFDG